MNIMEIPSISHPTDMHNFAIVDVDGVSYAFSYWTCIGFNDGRGWVLRNNAWGVTTGKHLNYLDDDHSKRLSVAEFQAAYRRMQQEAAI